MGRRWRRGTAFALSQGLGAWDRFRPQRQPLSSLRNFLLLPHFGALGPKVLFTAFIRALHAAVPGARIAVATNSAGLELYRNMPEVEQAFEVPSPMSGYSACARAIRAANLFRGEPFAAALPVGTGLVMHRFAAVAAGAAGAVYLIRSPERVPSLVFDPELSRIANDFRVIGALGHEEALRARLRRDPSLWEPHVGVPQRDRDAARALLTQAGVPDGTPYAVLVTQTRVSPPRAWRPEFFQQTAEWLYRTHGLPAVFVGAAGDSAAIERLRAPLQCPSADVSGKTSLLGLAAVLQGASVGLCFDTGAMHMGRAVKLPMVVIAPPSDRPLEWLPLGVPHIRVLYNTHMRVEDWAELPGELQPAAVQEHLQELLTAFPKRAESTVQA